jgi:hypothetical protein
MGGLCSTASKRNCRQTRSGRTVPLRRTHPADAVPGTAQLQGTVRYNYRGGTANLPVTVSPTVQPSAGTADGKVRIRFQDVPGDYDPSIADVWVVPLT